ncbi:MAG: hypothetical protein N3G20_05130, partial [Verrucomicrobiae bacterium]|nr:hypothetical protein [Verrucomicrobiae bacterium]
MAPSSTPYRRPSDAVNQLAPFPLRRENPSSVFRSSTTPHLVLIVSCVRRLRNNAAQVIDQLFHDPATSDGTCLLYTSPSP